MPRLKREKATRHGPPEFSSATRGGEGDPGEEVGDERSGTRRWSCRVDGQGYRAAGSMVSLHSKAARQEARRVENPRRSRPGGGGDGAARTAAGVGQGNGCVRTWARIDCVPRRATSVGGRRKERATGDRVRSGAPREGSRSAPANEIADLAAAQRCRPSRPSRAPRSPSDSVDYSLFHVHRRPPRMLARDPGSCCIVIFPPRAVQNCRESNRSMTNDGSAAVATAYTSLSNQPFWCVGHAGMHKSLP